MPPVPRRSPFVAGEDPAWRVSPALVMACVSLVVASGALAAGGLGVAAAIPLGLSALLLGARAPKLLVLIGFVAILFTNSLQIWVGDIGSYVDEVIPILVVVVAVAHRVGAGRRMRTFAGFWWLIAFALLGIVSALANAVPVSIWSVQGFLALKGVLFGLAVCQFDWNDRDVLRAYRVVGWFTLILIACGAANLVFGNVWNAALGLPNLTMRNGWPAIVGPFRHPSEYALVLAAAAVAVAAFRSSYWKSAASLSLLLGAGVASLLTWRRKTMVGVIAALIAIRFRASRLTTVMLLVLVGPIVVIGVWSDLADTVEDAYTEYLVHAESSARAVVTTGSFDVANTYFPLGAGFGRYGSYIAAQEYSPEYVSRGFQEVWGLSNVASGNNRWLTDTQWPAILGEAGYFGAACFMVAIVLMWRSALRNSRSGNDRTQRFIGLLGIGWIVLTVIESSASPVFYSAPGLVLLFAAAGWNSSIEARAGADANDLQAIAAKRGPLTK